jgi:hypothetical protein
MKLLKESALARSSPDFMTELQVVKYSADQKCGWDDFVRDSKNGVFLFRRDYMEYHSDRFDDYSLLFFRGEQLLALMPASLHGDALVSHGGLTFGGVVSDHRMKAALMLELLQALKEYLREQGIKKVVYKAVPHVYHDVPAEEDLYALFRMDAMLVRRDVASTISTGRKLGFSKGTKWSIKQGQKHELQVVRDYDFDTFMGMTEEALRARYGVRPVHSAAEMRLLAGRFPENIKLFTAYKGGMMMGGVIIYESKMVAHAQYISATEEGKAAGAVDLICGYLINEYYAGKPYFDFGISTEQNGRFLNTGLISNKESFGARAVVYDTYELDLRASA